MPQEIEHRYLLRTLPAHRGELPFAHIKQGYLSIEPDRTERVRIKGDKAYHTIKGKRVNGVADETERQITMAEADAMFARCDPTLIIEKTRYDSLEDDGYVWEIDIFKGKLDGLVIAEIELPDENASYNIPSWVDGPDITNDHELSNAALATKTRNQVIKLVRDWHKR